MPPGAYVPYISIPSPSTTNYASSYGGYAVQAAQARQAQQAPVYRYARPPSSNPLLPQAYASHKRRRGAVLVNYTGMEGLGTITTPGLVPAYASPEAVVVRRPPNAAAEALNALSPRQQTGLAVGGAILAIALFTGAGQAFARGLGLGA